MNNNLKTMSIRELTEFTINPRTFNTIRHTESFLILIDRLKETQDELDHYKRLAEAAIGDIKNSIHALWPGETSKEKTALNYICNAKGILEQSVFHERDNEKQEAGT